MNREFIHTLIILVCVGGALKLWLTVFGDGPVSVFFMVPLLYGLIFYLGTKK